jgi:hypothetical protein
VREAGLVPILEAAGSLEEAGRNLIAAANQAGGRDNITVILFRLAAVDDRRGRDTAATAEYETVEPGDGDDGSAGEARDEGEGGAARGAVALREPRTEPAAEAPAREPPARTMPLPQEPKRRSRRRSGGMLLLTLAVILPLLIGAWLATRAVYFIGTEPGSGRPVAIYRGLPYELPFGIELYETYYESGVPLADVPEPRRAAFTDHKLRTRDDAEDLVIRLEKGQVE